ncbi:MAG TPA: PEGA domain-containing protein [Kofleriaceae bacterium]|nr:PEGA domain-containing protein [Kofleriaceae bacterium]
MLEHAHKLLLGVMVLVATAGVARADKARAAEHFALAEKAEARKDWQSAIDEYQRAYDESPHPAVLFNIAKNHDRLGHGRIAVQFFERYLNDLPGAADRDRVRRRIEELRTRDSEVKVVGRPPGAAVIVDGEVRGTLPATLTLSAGTHRIQIEANGRLSAPQEFTLEYGDAITLRADLQVRPGILAVDANVDGAEVMLDGALAGHTPFRGSVPAGTYQLIVQKPGFRGVQREVEVPAGGSEQIRARLEPIDGKSGLPEPIAESGKWFFGTAYGLDVGGQGYRYIFDFGYRTSNNRFEVGVLLGSLGSGATGGAGLESRAYLGVGRFRPYLRAAVLMGSRASSDRLTLIEAGGGVLIVGTPANTPQTTARKYGIDYFIEIDVNAQIQTPVGDEQRIGVPIIGGLIVRFGG